MIGLGEPPCSLLNEALSSHAWRFDDDSFIISVARFAGKYASPTPDPPQTATSRVSKNTARGLEEQSTYGKFCFRRRSKDLVVVRGPWSVVRGPWSVSIDSHVRTYYYVNNVQYYFTK